MVKNNQNCSKVLPHKSRYSDQFVQFLPLNKITKLVKSPRGTLIEKIYKEILI